MEPITTLLWEYQQADHAVDLFYAQIKNAPQRLALQKKLDYLKEQQATIKNMEQLVAQRAEQTEQLKQDYQLLQKKLEQLLEESEANPPQNKQEAGFIAGKASRLEREMADSEKQLQRIIRETTQQEKLHKEIRLNYAKIKTEYDTEKSAYEALYHAQIKELHEKQEALARQSEALPQDLFKKYQALKKHIALPVARLLGNQCGGCMMNLPQATLVRFKGDVLYIECENCGRMIIQ